MTVKRNNRANAGCFRVNCREERRFRGVGEGSETADWIDEMFASQRGTGYRLVRAAAHVMRIA
jgi:hypothetical protein